MNWNQETKNYQIRPTYIKNGWTMVADNIEETTQFSFYKRDDEGLFMWMADFNIENENEAEEYWRFLTEKDV